MSKESLAMRLSQDTLLREICNTVGYVGFHFRELSTRLKPLVDQYGSRKVSAALNELVVHTGWRTMLNPQARSLCFAILGPAPEKWDEWYTTWDGKPTPRPLEHQTPPVIPEPQPDPFLEALVRLVYSELHEKLKAARRCKDVTEAQAIESEMLRRGMDIPPEEKVAEEKLHEKPAEDVPAETTRKKRTRKVKE